MNPLLTQFLTESRGLLEESSSALLELERKPDDSAQLDALFRAVHTIKGASGLFEIAPLTSAVHAGEDLLDAARAHEIAFSSDLADMLFQLLDQVSEWLDQLERTEQLDASAASIAATLANKLRDSMDGPRVDAGGNTEPTSQIAFADWPSEITADKRSAWQAAGPCHLITYMPDPHAFYSGDDPLLTMTGAPGLRWLTSAVTDPEAPLDTLDAFQCRLTFRAICSAEMATLADHFLYVEDQVELMPLTADSSDTAPADTGLVIDLIRSQRRLIAARGEDRTYLARLGSARALLQGLAARVNPPMQSEIKALQLAEDGAAKGLDALAARLESSLLPPVQPEASAPAPATAPESADLSPMQVAEPDPRKPIAIRVDAERIDALMNLVGELIVAKNAMPFLARRAEEQYGCKAMSREIKAQYDIVNRISDDLQGAIMQVRMVPVSTVFNRFNRLVRDLARKLDKKVRLVIEGEETEADKSVVEQLSDPMVHLIRNALDHGLETTQARREAGKPDEGTLRLLAYQRDDSVIIEVSDDGCGIDIDRVKAKALEKGVVSPEALDAMTDDAALQLILTPGLSTKEQISDLSGRGVGMDVVASMVRRIGGTIALSSQRGAGATVRITLPLSMAVQRMMMVEVEDGLYGVSIESIVESQRLPANRIHRHRDDETVILRERVIPLLRLRTLFGCAPRLDEDEVNLLVVDVDGNEVGLVVDRFHAGVDAIVKPMEGILRGSECFSGTALLGDGSVLLALNLTEILQCRWN